MEGVKPRKKRERGDKKKQLDVQESYYQGGNFKFLRVFYYLFSKKNFLEYFIGGVLLIDSNFVGNKRSGFY